MIYSFKEKFFHILQLMKTVSILFKPLLLYVLILYEILHVNFYLRLYRLPTRLKIGPPPLQYM